MVILHHMFLHQMMLLLVMVKHNSILNVLIPIDVYCLLQTLDEVVYVETIKGKLIIEVIF